MPDIRSFRTKRSEYTYTWGVSEAIPRKYVRINPESLAAALGFLLGNRAPTLLIDADPQGNLTQAFGINPDKLEATLYEVLVHRKPLEQMITPLAAPPEWLSIVGANLDLGETTMQLAGNIVGCGCMGRFL